VRTTTTGEDIGGDRAAFQGGPELRRTVWDGQKGRRQLVAALP
jgi:hypothetical protein